MKQFIQNFKTGELKLEDVPVPAVRSGFVRVNNVFSLISAGTERQTIDTGKSSLLGKAKKRPDLVKQVLQNIQKEGILATLGKIKTKLDAPKALGYSSCGFVLDSGDFNGKFNNGERVACAGQDYASHAEIVCVPQNLVAKIPDNVGFKEASFTTVGAIALQGVRQADAKIGEKICVIGLGLIGQITAQILKANGCLVFGIDMSEFCVETSRKLGIDCAVTRKDKDLYGLVDNFTKGYGFDKVIITASSKDNDPVIVSTEILRKKGIVVVVGDVKIDIPRNPHFYKKELELKMATSYGPGRYDSLYEEAGVDYPYGYVRFTENRNMEVFLDLVSKGVVNVKSLITHVFEFKHAKDAFDLVLGVNKEKSIGILLKYNEEEVILNKITINSNLSEIINVGFVGAGSFAQSYLLPYLKAKDVSLDTVVTTRGITAKSAAKKFGFNCASTNSADVSQSTNINTIFIATRHDSHAHLVCKALENNKNVFVEKPLAINVEQLKQIVSIYQGESILMVGYNRRFAPLSLLIKQDLKKVSAPMVMNYRINAGYISDDSWIQDPEAGGGRIIGEVCHFIDFLTFLSGSLPKKVYASSIRYDNKKCKNNDNISITIDFIDGSVGNIIYTSMGSKGMPKERVEIFSQGNSYLIDDFKQGMFYRGSSVKRINNKGKGHKQEIQQFIKAVKDGKGNPIDFESLLSTTLATFKIIDSLNKKSPQDIDINELYP